MASVRKAVGLAGNKTKAVSKKVKLRVAEIIWFK